MREPVQFPHSLSAMYCSCMCGVSLPSHVCWCMCALRVHGRMAGHVRDVLAQGQRRGVCMHAAARRRACSVCVCVKLSYIPNLRVEPTGGTSRRARESARTCLASTGRSPIPRAAPRHCRALRLPRGQTPLGRGTAEPRVSSAWHQKDSARCTCDLRAARVRCRRCACSHSSQDASQLGAVPGMSL